MRHPDIKMKSRETDTAPREYLSCRLAEEKGLRRALKVLYRDKYKSKGGERNNVPVSTPAADR